MTAAAPNITEVDFPDKLGVLFEKLRYKIFHGGRGGSKSWGVARALLLTGVGKPLRILCAREVQKSIKESVHQLLADQIEMMGLGAHYEVLETLIRGDNGTLILFAGLSNQTVESIKSYEGIDRVWIEEAQSVKKRSWEILIPTIRKEDSEIWLTLNPELDTDDTYVRFIENPPPDSAVVQINYNDNPWFPTVLEQERLHCYNTNREDYDNIWEGKCRKSVIGAIYANQIESAVLNKRICNVPFDSMLKVHCIWDLGFNDQMTITMVQRVASEIRIIDYLEASHQKLEWYVKELRKNDYNWGQDWLPHDGFYKDYKTGKSAYEILKALGRDVAYGDTTDPAVPNIKVEQGIKEARMVFERCYFDKVKAARLVTCLKRYRRRINTMTQEPEGPLHDEFSHGADSFRYLALVADRLKNEVIKHTPSPPEEPLNWRAI